MSKNVTSFALVCSACVVVVACADSPQLPSAPGAAIDARRAAVIDALIDTPLEEDEGRDTGRPRFDPGAAAQGALGGRASGHAQIQGTPVQNVRDQRYSFTADPHGEAPSAKGQVQVHYLLFTGEEIRVHAEVTCTSVVGNQAWVGARVTRFVLNGEELALDRRMIFRVQDNGDDADATDLASLVFFGAAGLDLRHCNTRQQFPTLRGTITGNIQVKPSE